MSKEKKNQSQKKKKSRTKTPPEITPLTFNPNDLPYDTSDTQQSVEKTQPLIPEVIKSDMGVAESKGAEMLLSSALDPETTLAAKIQNDILEIAATKLDMTKEILEAVGSLVEGIKKTATESKSPQSLAIALGILVDKVQLMSGGATNRMEISEPKQMSTETRMQMYDILNAKSGGKG